MGVPSPQADEALLMEVLKNPSRACDTSSCVRHLVVFINFTLIIAIHFEAYSDKNRGVTGMFTLHNDCNTTAGFIQRACILPGE